MRMKITDIIICVIRKPYNVFHFNFRLPVQKQKLLGSVELNRTKYNIKDTKCIKNTNVLKIK